MLDTNGPAFVGPAIVATPGIGIGISVSIGHQVSVSVSVRDFDIGNSLNDYSTTSNLI